MGKEIYLQGLYVEVVWILLWYTEAKLLLLSCFGRVQLCATP